MEIIFIVISIVLLIWVYVLHSQVKDLTKDLKTIGKWNAYLENTIKEAKVLVLNSNKGEWEINEKLLNLLK